MRRRLLAPLAVLLAVFVLLGVSSAPVGAQDEVPSSTTTQAPAPDIIPEPNQGVEPQDAGDRGGSLQTFVFALIVAGTVVIGALVVRESRKARAERGF